MKFKFQLHDGRAYFSTWLTLCFQATLLLFVRFCRFCKRILIYLKRYIPIFFCIILFEAIIIPVGIHLGKYTSWIDGIWDLRSFFFTAILISIVGGILQEENKRHKGLVKQFDTYKSFMLESEKFCGRLCYLLGVKHNQEIFMNESQHDDFRCCVYSKIEVCEKYTVRKLNDLSVAENPHFIYSTPSVKPKAYIKIIFEHYLKVLDTLRQCIQQSSFIGPMEHAVSQLDDIYENIQKEMIQIESDDENYTEIQLLRFTECISRYIYPAIADIRHPWRWDIKINNAMDRLLNQ